MSLLRSTLLALAALLAATGAHAQIAFRGASQAGVASGVAVNIAYVASNVVNGGAASATVNRPGGIVVDRLMVAQVTLRDVPGSITAPAGWTALGPAVSTSGGNPLTQAIYWRRMVAAEPASYTFSWAGSRDYVVGISSFDNVDIVGSPINASGVQATNNNATITIPSINTTVANTMLVALMGVSRGTTISTPTGGMFERYDQNSGGGGGATASMATQAFAGTGATGARTAMQESGGPRDNIAHILALRPASNGLTIARPAGTVAGDVMIAAIAVRPSSVIITPPPGWAAQAAALQNASGNSSRQQIFYRVAGGAEPASYTWLFDSAHTGAVGGIISFSGVDTAAPFDAYAGNLTPQGADSNLQHRALAVTTTVPDTMVISTHSFTSAMPWTPPAGMTERVDVASIATPNAVGISLEMNTVTQAAIGSTGDKVATVTGNGDTGSATLMALRPFVPQPVLHWRMDSAAWTGAANEVVDSSGNNLHGRSFNGANTAAVTPAIAGSPGTCRYGVFDGVNDYVETADNALLDITDELTVMMWLRPTAYPTGGGLKSFMSKDTNYEAHINSSGQVFWWWGGGAQQLTTAGTVPLNAWTHVAIVYSRAGAFQRIYLNGVQDPNTNNQNAALTTNNSPFQIGGDQGFAGREWPGLVDEVYVFRSALSAARVNQYMNTTRPCASFINHWSISHTGSGVGCVDQPITITAHDATHNPVDANALTVTLSTTNAQGTWTGIQAGGGTLNDPVPGDGVATYTFAVGATSATLLFRYAALGAATETFGFNVSGGGFTETSGAATPADDPSFTMSQAGFRFRNIDDANETIITQISGKPSNTGWNARTYRLQAINTNTSTGSCSNLFSSQTQTVDLGAECNDPAACAARQVDVNGTPIATSNNNGGAGAAAYTGVALAFNANSEADIVLTYPDAGEISMHAQFDLNPLVAGIEMIGSSNNYVVRPFGLAFPGVVHANTATDAVLAAAGDPFAMTVQGFQWAAGEDANNDGVPDAGVNITDNGTVPNFAATATVGVSANLPGVAAGTLGRGAGCANPASVAMTGGAGAAADWCYSEVGNVLLTANVANYLAPGVDIAGNSGLDGTGAAAGHVGRFRPKRFRLTGAAVFTPRIDATCAPPSSFAYMGEPIRLDGFKLEAVNTQNVRTNNYDGAYALHVPNPVVGLAKAGFGIGARSGTTDHTGRVSATYVALPAWAQGLLEGPGAANVRINLAFDRNGTNTPDGPYAATDFGIAPADSDGVQLQGYDLDVDNDTTFDHLRVGTTDVRFGRLVMFGTYGANTINLPVNLEVQYWNGTSFAPNGDDNCTSFQRSDFALTFAPGPPPPPNLVACETAMSQASITFASGRATLTMAKPPSSADVGTVTVTANLDSAAGTYCPAVGAGTAMATNAAKSYLLGRWDSSSAAHDDKPSASVGFGLYGSQPRNFIFFRENY